MARRSATECAAILDIIETLELGDQEHVRDGGKLLQTIVAMLVGLVKHMERQETSPPEPRLCLAFASA